MSLGQALKPDFQEKLTTHKKHIDTHQLKRQQHKVLFNYSRNMVKLVSKIIFLFSVHSYFPIHSICKVSSISTYVKWADKKENRKRFNFTPKKKKTTVKTVWIEVQYGLRQHFKLLLEKNSCNYFHLKLFDFQLEILSGLRTLVIRIAFYMRYIQHKFLA